MLGLSMKGLRFDGLDGQITVKVEPSLRIQWAVAIHVNDHYQAKSDTTGTDGVHELLTTNWEKSLKRSREIIQLLVGRE
jgi:hypothetical protein